MNKKLFLILVSALLVFGFCVQARAEMSATSYTGTAYREQQVFTYMYNNSSTALTTASVVVLDVSGGTGGSTLGAYVTTTTTADDKYVFGVADEAIAAGSVGRICVRGPHKVLIESGASIVAGDIISASNTELHAQEYATSDGTLGGVLGYALEAASGGTDINWIWVAPQQHK